jgi:probable rRNA maturation factor
MDTPAVSIDSYIDLDEAEQDTSLQRALEAGLPEQVAARTLRAAGITTASRPSYSLSLVITGDEAIRALNRQYRQQDQPTDVLSFPLLDAPLVDAPADQPWAAQASAEIEGDLGDAGQHLQQLQAPQPSQPQQPRPAFVTPAELATNLGDIVISWPTVVRQAEQAGHHPLYELLYLFSHGLLHLAGYDDQTEAGYAAMVGIQDVVMREIDWQAFTR